MNIWFFNHYAVPTSLYPLARPYHFANHLQQKGHKVTIFAASSVHLSDKNLITDGRQMRAKRVDGVRYVFLKARNYEGNGLGRIMNFFDYTIRLFTQTGKFNKPDVIMATSVHPLTCVAGRPVAADAGRVWCHERRTAGDQSIVCPGALDVQEGRRSDLHHVRWKRIYPGYGLGEGCGS